MKTKINFLFIAITVLFSSVSCNDDFLELEPEGFFLTDTYYTNEAEAFTGLVATYDIMRKNSGGFENMVTMMNAGSDDCLGGGDGRNNDGIQAFSRYDLTQITIPGSFWNDHYQGVFRANLLIQRIVKVPMDENKKNRYIAEVKALRALYYFNLVRMFKNIPIVLKPLLATEIYEVVQATPAQVYLQIQKDLLEAIPVLPTILGDTEKARFSKGAAIALLGKVYLYDGKNALAVEQLAQVNGTPGGTSQYGYRLQSSFSELWRFSNKFNTEAILEASHSANGNTVWGVWGTGQDEGNTMNVMVAPRNYTRSNPLSTAPDLPSGWSFNPVTQNLYDVIRFDPRFSVTILDMKALKTAGLADYQLGYQNTGYFLNKFIPRRSEVQPGIPNPEINYRQNSYVIRLADTYLLEAEALGGTGSRAQALLDAVRARVGLSTVPVSLAAIANERRLELAGEGHRFFDLVRTGQAKTVLASKGFIENKNEIFPIPEREILLTKWKQNPGYQQ